MFEKKLLDGTKVPQIGCDMQFNFSGKRSLVIVHVRLKEHLTLNSYNVKLENYKIVCKYHTPCHYNIPIVCF